MPKFFLARALSNSVINSDKCLDFFSDSSFGEEPSIILQHPPWTIKEFSSGSSPNICTF